MKNIIICGDSFSIGIGCHDLKNEPYGSLLSKRLDRNLINMAKGSSSNFSIFLQVKYIIEKYSEIDFVCVAPTSYNRTEWFPENYKNKKMDLNNTDVNYHQYPPYHRNSYIEKLENPMKDDKNYTGEMFTENFYGIIDYVDTIIKPKKNNTDYFAKFNTERPERLKLLYDYYFEIFDERIQRQYDIGVIVMSHLLLKNKNINHLILSDDSYFSSFVPEENLVPVNWGLLSLNYPDDLKTLHTSSEGQKMVYELILKKLKNNNWIN